MFSNGRIPLANRLVSRPFSTPTWLRSRQLEFGHFQCWFAHQFCGEQWALQLLNTQTSMHCRPTLGIRQLAATLAGASWLGPRVGTSITRGIDDMWQQAAASMGRLRSRKRQQATALQIIQTPRGSIGASENSPAIYRWVRMSISYQLP